MIYELESSINEDSTVYLSHHGVTLNGMLRLDPAGFILSVFVAEDCRGLGIGSTLIERAVEICKERGAETIGLWVADDNARAQQLYRRLGFLKYITGHEGHTQFVKPLK